MALNDERRPVGGGESSSSLARPSKGTPDGRQTDVWHAMATVYRVVGTRGRQRSVIVVEHCPFRCGWLHVHSGKPDFVTGKRTASCRRGRYVVHTGALSGEEAA